MKEYSKISGEDEHIDVVHDGPPRDTGEEGDEGGKKKGKTKPPNMNRLLKSRLQKLVDKTDDTCVELIFLRLIFLVYVVPLDSVVACSPPNSWNSLPRKIGRHTIKRSNDLNVSRISSCVSSIPSSLPSLSLLI